MTFTPGTTVTINNSKISSLNGKKARVVEGYEPFNQQMPNTVCVRPEQNPFVFRMPAYCLETYTD